MTTALHTLIRTVSALAAAAVTSGIVVGIPILLWLLAERLLGDSVLTATNPVDLLLRPDDGTLLLGFLVLVAAAAWLVLTVSIVAEFAGALSGRPVPRIDLPGFRMGHSVAAALVAAVLGAGPAVAATAVTTPVSLVSMQENRAVVAPPETDRDDGPVHVVAHRDTLWRIAETTMGDPLRWREIYDLNTGRGQPDGGRLTEASNLSVGWILRLPDDARPTVQVQRGDTLSGLAAEHLGDPGRAAELFTANSGTPQPGGASLVDPDLIVPGWTLALPEIGDRPSSAARALPEEPAAGRAPTGPPISTPPNAPPDLPTPSSEQAAPADTTALPTQTRTPSPSPAEPSPSVTDARETPDPSASGEDSGDPGAAERAGWVVPALGVSAVVTGGAVTALALRRRRQLRHRPFRHKIAVPADDDGRVEWDLAHARPETEERGSVAQQLDLALRALSHPDRPIRDEAAPVLRSIRLTDSHALLTTIGSADIPAPFTSTDEANVWGLDVDTPLPVPANEAAGCCAPFPALVSIATDPTSTGERTLMIDLEQRGALVIGGDPARCAALLRHIAAELGTSPTAEDTEVLLVGLGDELEALNPERLHSVDDLDSALTEIEHRADATRTALDSWQFDSVVDGRLRDVAADSWLPTVLLVAHPLGTHNRTRLDAVPGATGVAVVAIDDHDPELVVDGDCQLNLPDVHDGPWRAAQLTENAGTHLAALLGTTAAPPIPVGPAPADDQWARGMNEDGSLADPTPAGEAPAIPRSASPAHGQKDDPSGPPPAQMYPGTVPKPRPDHDQPIVDAPPVDDRAARRLAITRHQDPHLDDDLAAWHHPAIPNVPMIAILGEPTVRAPGPAPTNRSSWFAEVLVYLSLHPAGITASTAVTDLWPDGHRISPATVRHAFYGARKWAGRGLGGDPDAAFVSDMAHDNTYRLRGHQLDWDLFRRLRKRGQARHDAHDTDSIADYRAALSLIRGPVLTALRPGGYAWLNNHDQRHDLQIPGFIVDTAHEMVDIALAAGDTATARWAAERAQAVDIDVAFDQPLTDLMRIAHAEDNRAELELHAAVLLDARGFDVPEELAPDSFTVLNELLPAGPRRPRP